MEKLFIPYPLAILAKEKGFIESCFAFYQNNELTFYDPTDYKARNWSNAGWLEDYEWDCAAPLYQQIVDWFREVHEINVYVLPWDKGWIPYTYKNQMSHIVPMRLDRNYYEALDASIEEAFNLI